MLIIIKYKANPVTTVKTVVKKGQLPNALSLWYFLPKIFFKKGFLASLLHFNRKKVEFR